MLTETQVRIIIINKTILINVISIEHLLMYKSMYTFTNTL